MQNIYNCNKYSPNNNLNKTCNNKTRCILIDNDNCYQYDNVKDCTTCERLTIETYVGVCDLFGILNQCMNNCEFYRKEKH